MDEPIYTVVAAPGPTSGGDTVIAACPPEIKAFLSLVPGALVVGGPVPDYLRQLGDLMADHVGERLARGEFKITSDPDVVRDWGIMAEHADCPDCQAGIERSVAALEQDPEVMLIVGRLYWTANTYNP